MITLLLAGIRRSAIRLLPNVDLAYFSTDLLLWVGCGFVINDLTYFGNATIGLFIKRYIPELTLQPGTIGHFTDMAEDF